jgi:NAD(P)H-dependent FMN reductase
MTAHSVLILCGSRRTPSYTASLASAIAASLERAGATVDYLVPDNLPFADPDTRLQRETHVTPAVSDLFTRAGAATAIVLASPVYHNSSSGLLKNALDWLGMREFRGKAVGLASHGGSSPQPVDHLRIVTRAVQAIAIPTQVCTAEAHYGPLDEMSGTYPVVDAGIGKRIEKFTTELLDFTDMLERRNGA